MNILKKPAFLPSLALALGAAGFGLRKALYAFALDQKGLLVSAHPLSIALWAVVLAGAAWIFWSLRKQKGSAAYEDNFASSRSAAFGCGAMAAGLLATVLNATPSGTGTIILLWRLLGFLTAPVLLWASICRSKGKKPSSPAHALLCLFLLVHMVSRYQIWSGNPQLQDYVFELLAAVALTLFSYHCAAFEVDMGSRRMLVATGVLAVLLCAVALSGTRTPGLYLCGMVWAATSLCALNPLPEEEVNANDAS